MRRGYIRCCRLLSLRGYIIYLIIGYIHISLSLLAFIHSSLITLSIIIIQSIQSIQRFPPTPSPWLSLICWLYACPPPPGVGGAGVDDDGVAGVDDWSGRGCGVRAAHSPSGSFAARQ